MLCRKMFKRDYTKYDIALYVLYVLIAAWSSWYTIYKILKQKMFLFLITAYIFQKHKINQ